MIAFGIVNGCNIYVLNHGCDAKRCEGINDTLDCIVRQGYLFACCSFKLKRLLADTMLDNVVLKNLLGKN